MKLQPDPAHRARVKEFLDKHDIELLVLLFTDIVGSVKLKQELGDPQAILLIKNHNELVRNIRSQFKQAEEIGTAGDSFLIVFSKPSDAVKFSLLLQSKLRVLALSTGHPVFIRIGIHVGEVIVEAHEDPNRPNDLYGIHLDTSSRIMSLAQADQILMSRFVFDNARPVIRGQDLEGVGELSFMNHGPYRFKGVEEPTEVCEIGETGKALLRQPPSSEKAERYVSADMEPVLGWRPALNLRVPDSEWVLEEKLGEGGFGEVWLGRHETLHEKGVFKFCFRKDRVRALRQQVRIFKVLGHHPNIVSVRGVYFDQPPYYIMMDFVEGWDLSSWCKAEGGIEKIPLTTRLEVVAQIADALQAAHDREVIHRDVKPSNILISKPSTRGFELKAMLTDFGVGQVVSNEALAKVTRLGFTQAMMLPGSSSGGGTQMFMAPELLAGKSATKRSDIYSLGVVLYQLLVGDLSRPLTIDWAKEIHDPLLRDDLAHCFAGNPQERFASAGQLAINLRSLEKRRVLKRRATYRRAFSVAATVVLLVATLFAAKKWWEHKVLREKHMTIAAERLKADDASTTLAHLAYLTRKFPYNRQAAQLLIDTLTHRSFALPLIHPLLHSNSIQGAQFSPDGHWIVTESLTNTIRVWNASSAQPVLVEHYVRKERPPEFSPDSNWLVKVLNNKTQAQVWDTKTGAALFPKPLEHEQEIYFAQFSPDGRWVATRSRDKKARVWDARTGLLTNEFVHPGAVYAMAFSPDGHRLATGSGNADSGSGAGARICDILTGRPSPTNWLKHSSNVASVLFSPDGQRLVTGSDDFTARVWDAFNGQPLSEPITHPAQVWTARFTPEGERIITGTGTSDKNKGKDNAARIWDVRIGKALDLRMSKVPLLVPAPDWLADLAEAVARKRATPTNGYETVPVENLLKLQGRLRGKFSPHDFYTRWGRWFFDDRSTRTISPFSSVTVPQYVHTLIEANTFESLHEAVLIAPTNAVALARLAVAVLRKGASTNPRSSAEAHWLSRRALELSPNDKEVLKLRVQVSENNRSRAPRGD